MNLFQIIICILLGCSIVMAFLYAKAQPVEKKIDEIYESHIHHNNDDGEMLFMQ